MEKEKKTSYQHVCDRRDASIAFIKLIPAAMLFVTPVKAVTKQRVRKQCESELVRGTKKCPQGLMLLAWGVSDLQGLGCPQLPWLDGTNLQ